MYIPHESDSLQAVDAYRIPKKMNLTSGMFTAQHVSATERLGDRRFVRAANAGHARIGLAITVEPGSKQTNELTHSFISL